MVRANYNDLKNGVHETTEYLELFLRNLLLNEKNELQNRRLYISGMLIEKQKADMRDPKADIENQKPDIQNIIRSKCPEMSAKTVEHVTIMYRNFCSEPYFFRSDVEQVIGLKSSRASELLKELLIHNMIEPVKGHGKGKYKFR